MRMTPIDYNNRDPRRRSWGRFGEPEQPYSPQVDSLKLPRRFGEPEQPFSPNVDSLKIPKRKGSFDGSSNINNSNTNKSFEEAEKLQGDKGTNNSRCSSPNTSNVGRGRQSRLRRRSFRRPSFEIPTIEGSNSNSNSDFDEDDEYLCRRAAQQHLQQQQQPALGLDAPTTPIRRASTGTRDLANSLFGTAQPLLDEKPRRVSISGPRPCMVSSRDAPIRRRSFGGTRPCMENTLNCDGPILRPYRQLSSDDLCIDMGCIGEETDEDLRSNRSNRSCLDDFSKRSNRMMDFSNRSNRSCFRDFSTRSRTCVPETLDNTTTSPVHEEPSESSASPLPAEPTSPQHEPEPWSVKPNMIKSIEDNPALSRSKTWPTNLMILLSIKKLSLKEEDLDSGDEEDSSEEDCCSNEENGLCDDILVTDGDGNPQLRRKGKSNSPYRSKNTRRRLLRTIHKASEVMEGEKSRALSILNNF